MSSAAQLKSWKCTPGRALGPQHWVPLETGGCGQWLMPGSASISCSPKSCLERPTLLLLRLMATLVDVTFICAGQKGGWPLRRDMAAGPGFPMPHACSYNRRSCLSVLPPRSQFSGFQDSDDAAPLGTRVLLQTDDENISTAPAKAEPRRGSTWSWAVLPGEMELRCERRGLVPGT